MLVWLLAPPKPHHPTTRFVNFVWLSILLLCYRFLVSIQVYVIGYNVYLWNTTSQPASSPIPITKDGTKDQVRYGVPDWVYEGNIKGLSLCIHGSALIFKAIFINISEEVISSNHAVWWSRDGAALLYASFNDTLVEEYSFPKYGPFKDVYTTIIDIPYPKVYVM